MIPSARFQMNGHFSLLLICALLGACATTQKSSSGAGDQPAAPISDAQQQQAESKPGDKPAPSSAATAAAPSPSSAAAPAAAAGTSGGNAATKPGSSESGVTITDSEEEAQLKRQLAEQDAQINRLRTDQQVETAKEETEAAKAQEQQAIAAAGANDRQPASSGTAPAAQSKSQEEAAVFPANANAAEPGGVESGKSAAPATLERSVYFDYNQATVPDKYDSMLVANAAYLKAHPGVKAEVQGNCDERGSREYNLALGARRAQAVKRALELAGANGGNISAISYGAEKPVALGKDEASYSRNRRADIVY
jgi:peptidoglycan-associated lipoprotein